MDEDLKRTLDEQLANGLITVHDYSRKLDVLREASRLVEADRSRRLPGLTSGENEGPTSTTYPPLPIEHKGGGLGMYARRIRAWFRETPFRWSILTFFVPWFLRIPFAKLAKWRRGDLRYYYADGQNVRGPLSFEDIESHVLAGTIGMRTLILREDSHHWLPLKLTEFSFRLENGERDRVTSQTKDGHDCDKQSERRMVVNTAVGCLSPIIAVGLCLLVMLVPGIGNASLDNISAKLIVLIWWTLIALMAAWRTPSIWRAMKTANRVGTARQKDFSLLAVIAVVLTVVGIAAFSACFYLLQPPTTTP
jgi:hypothetical protein